MEFITVLHEKRVQKACAEKMSRLIVNNLSYLIVYNIGKIRQGNNQHVRTHFRANENLYLWRQD